MKPLNEFLNESKKVRFKKGDKVKFKDEYNDEGDNFTYELIENPDGGRVKVQAIDTNLSFPPVEVVKLDWLIKESLNESKHKFKLKDFVFYKYRGSSKMMYSFEHKPTNIEADIYLGYGSFGRGSSERTAYVDYLEFVEEPDEDTVEALEEFIEDNLDYIFDNAKKI